MEIVKIFKAGNSLVVALPASMRDVLKWNAGDRVLMELGNENKVQLSLVSDVISKHRERKRRVTNE